VSGEEDKQKLGLGEKTQIYVGRWRGGGREKKKGEKKKTTLWEKPKPPTTICKKSGGEGETSRGGGKGLADVRWVGSGGEYCLSSSRKGYQD